LFILGIGSAPSRLRGKQDFAATAYGAAVATTGYYYTQYFNVSTCSNQVVEYTTAFAVGPCIPVNSTTSFIYDCTSKRPKDIVALKSSAKKLRGLNLSSRCIL
jgi:hypothetical protein